jgi:hypothetical protein
VTRAPEPLEPVDPFDLPEWLGEHEVTWAPATGVRRQQHVTGLLTGQDDEQLACDLLAVDTAFPQPVVVEDDRVGAHQAWQRGQLHLGRRADRLTLLVPGHEFTADLALTAVGRLARSVGADPQRYVVTLRLSTADVKAPGEGSH